MQDKIKFGSLSKTHKLDDEGSTVSTTVTANKGMIHPQIKLEYTIRHRIQQPEDEDVVYSLFRNRQRQQTLFNTGITFEGKNKLKPAPYYYMIEHFTMYKRDEAYPHIRNFIEEEKKELGL